MNDTPLSEARLSALLEAYGARPEHWPERERSAAVDLLATSESARSLAREQQGLDAWLTMSVAPTVPTELIEHLNAIPERRGALLLANRLRSRALWMPALGWAAAAAVGLWLGAHAVTAESTEVTSTAIDQAAAQNENELLALSGGLLDELEEP